MNGTVVVSSLLLLSIVLLSCHSASGKKLHNIICCSKPEELTSTYVHAIIPYEYAPCTYEHITVNVSPWFLASSGKKFVL